MNQKSLETFLGNCREDMYDGGQLIPLYRQFVRTGEQDLLAALLLHNREDVTGMLQLLSLYGYTEFLKTFLADASSEEPPIQTELICLRDGSRRLLLRFFLDPAVPVPLSRMTESGVFSLNQNTGKWLIPVREDPLRYYFPTGKTITICRRKTRPCTKAWPSTWIKNSGSPVHPKTAISPEPVPSFPSRRSCFPRAAGKPQRQTELVPSHR